MSDIPLKNITSGINPGSVSGTNEVTKQSGSGFDTVINEAMSKVTEIQEDVNKAVNELAAGGDITSAVLAIEKADMNFQLMVEIRNKLISTYEEVMRMQV